MLYPVHVFLMVFNGIDAVKRERREQGDSRYRFADFSHGRSDLIRQQMAAQARFGRLPELDLDGVDLAEVLFGRAVAVGDVLEDELVG